MKRLTLLLAVLVAFSGCRGGASRPGELAIRDGVTRTAEAGTDPGAVTGPDGKPIDPKTGAGSKPADSNGAPGVNQTPTPHNKAEGNEKVTWDQLTEWWPYRPLLRFDETKFPMPGGHESFYVSSPEGGRKGDPRKKVATATVFYEIPPNTTDKVHYFGVTDGGGIAVTARFYPPSSNFDKANIGGKLITIRGFPAKLNELRRDLPPEEENSWRSNSTDNVRFIQWQQDVPGTTGVVDWLIIMDPTKYTEQRSIEIANALREIR